VSLTHLTRADCPQCGRRLQGIPFMFDAVTESRRSCPKCHTRWRILAKPMIRRAGVSATRLEWLAV
jgi:ribosomal protein S27AE